MDTSLWYPLAVLFHHHVTGDRNFLRSHAEKIDKAIFWASCLDQNNDFLLETNEGADWMDLLLRSGRVLYDNVLYYASLKAADKIHSILGGRKKYDKLSAKVKKNINLFFWPEENNRESVLKEYGHTGIEKDFEAALNNGTRNYYFVGIADKERAGIILDEIGRQKADQPYPVKVLVPPIGDDEYRKFYFRWTAYPHLQQAGNYHNGGIWPLAGGFHVIALELAGRNSSDALGKLAAANQLGNKEFEFNEWLSAEGVPLGSAYQSWSAGMYILAHQVAKGDALQIF